MSEPKFLVQSILGVKYPDNENEFKNRFALDAIINPSLTFSDEKANRRMKIPIPVTWERLLSVKGNNASTWEELIKN